jgi:hypothetical protein
MSSSLPAPKVSPQPVRAAMVGSPEPTWIVCGRPREAQPAPPSAARRWIGNGGLKGGSSGTGKFWRCSIVPSSLRPGRPSYGPRRGRAFTGDGRGNLG